MTPRDAELPVKGARSVIFDLGGVLLEWQPAKVLAKCFRDLASQEAARDAILLHDDWRSFDRGDLSEPDLISRVCGRTSLSSSEVQHVLDTIRNSLIELPETVDILRNLCARGVSLYCLSNMPVSIFNYVRERSTFWDAFRGVVISGEIGLVKPEHAAFEHLLGRYKLNAIETAFVDDHPPNIAGARAVGMEAILFRNADQCRRDLAAFLAID
jgi:HAD superfamily hydrolase (TIGR01509 family)